MHKHNYALFLETDLNRVYSTSLGDIAAAELSLVLDALHPATLGTIDVITEGRSTRLSFDCDLAPEELGPLAGQLSASLALFEQDGENFRTTAMGEQLRFGSELVTTQRYKGKTNERFTRAMVTVAMAAAGIDLSNPDHQARPITLCDPMCGRGTTLNWALAFGLNAIGIEPDRNALDQQAIFIGQWAKRQRLPHLVQDYRPANAERRHSTFTVAPDRDELKEGLGQTLQTFCADGGDTSLPIKRDSLDVIVTDLPYGIHHASRQPGGSARNKAKWDPTDTVALLERLAPAWKKWLRPSGAIALAWNTKRAGTDEVGDALTELGFTRVVVNAGAGFAHRVDNSIERDIIVARL